MKIMQVNSVYNFGSTGRIVKDLKEVIQSQGAEGVIIYGRGNDSSDNNVFKIGADLDFKLHVIYSRLTDKSGFFSSYYTRKVIKKIKEYAPDLIHLHNVHGYYINIELLFNFIKEYGKPIVWTLHDCWPFTGHCAYYDAVSCQKWQEECKKCPQTHEYPKSFIDNSLDNFHRKKILFTSIEQLYLVTPSEWLKQEVKKSFLKEYPCYVIPNGIDLKEFNSNNFSQENKNIFQPCKKLKILGVASVWDNRKGLNDFIKLSKLLDLNKYQITMVGVNKKQKAMLEECGIIAIERTNSIQALVDLYQQADVFFNPTYQDNFPTTNLESLACGTPVLTYRTGGSPESLTEKCGVVVDKGNLELVVSCLQSWESYQFQANDCITQARKFDKFLKFNEYYELYNDILYGIK